MSACPHCEVPLERAALERCTTCRRLLVIEDRYEIRRLIGRGGMSRVYEGFDRKAQSPVAIKMVVIAEAQGWKAVELFERGTTILRGLRHPALPTVHAFVQDEGAYFQVREYYACGSLEAFMHGRARLDRKQVHYLLKALLELLQYLHTRVPPVLHRDIKPANIMLRSTQGSFDPVLVDFDTSAADGPTSRGTTIVVSAGYSAPEQLAGQAQPASDLYSLGMTMLFVLSGGQSPLDLPKKDSVPDIDALLCGLEPATRTVIKKLSHADLGSRYRSARDALADLAGRPSEAIAATGGRANALVRPITIVGASLFRVAVGVLLGLIVAYVLLVVYQMRSTQSAPRSFSALTSERVGVGVSALRP